MATRRCCLSVSVRHGAACSWLQAPFSSAQTAAISAEAASSAPPRGGLAQAADDAPLPASALTKLGRAIRGTCTGRSWNRSVGVLHVPGGYYRGFSLLPVEDSAAPGEALEESSPAGTDVSISQPPEQGDVHVPAAPDKLPGKKSLIYLRKTLNNLSKSKQAKEAVALYEAWRSQEEETLSTYGPFIPDVGTAGNYVHAVYSASRDPLAVRAAIDQAEKDGVRPSPQLYNTLIKATMISMANRNPKPMAYKCKEVLEEMEAKGGQANFVTRAILARANITAGHFIWAKSELDDMKKLAGGAEGVVLNEKIVANNLEQHAYLLGRLVASRFQMYAATQGYEVLRELLEGDVQPAAEVMVSILEVLPDGDQVFDRELTLKVLDLVLAIFTATDPAAPLPKVHPTEGCLLTLLLRAARTGDVELAKPAWIINRRVCSATGRVPCIAAYQSVITCRMRAGDLKGVLRMVAELERDYPDNLEARTPIPALRCITDAVGQSAHQVDAMYFEAENLQKEDMSVTTAMMNCVIGACVRLRDMSRMFETYESYASFGIAPDTNTFNMLLLGAYGSREDQIIPALLEEMQSLGIALNRQTYEILINVKLRDGDLAGSMGLLREMSESGYSPSTSALLRLAARGPWDEAGERLLAELYAACGAEYTPKPVEQPAAPKEEDETPQGESDQ